MSLQWPERPNSNLTPGKRYGLFMIAHKLFPTSLLIKIIAFLLWTSPLIFNFLQVHYGIDSILTRGLLTLAIVGGIPTVVVYFITFVRASSIRKIQEVSVSHERNVTNAGMDVQKNYDVALDDSSDE